MSAGVFLYLAITAEAMLFAWGVRNEKCLPASGSALWHSRQEAVNRVLLMALFLVLFIPAAIRLNVGNDYMRYVAFFHLASVDAYVPTEPGFNALAKAIYVLCGYENYLLLFALYACLTILFFLVAIRKQAETFFPAFALFLAFGYYFQTYNTVRYYFALSLCTLALGELLRKRYAAFLFLTLCAALFHKSMLVTLALYPLCVLPWNLWIVLLGGTALLVLSAFREFWMQVVVKLYPSYEGTAFLAGGQRSMAGIVRCAGVLFLAAIVMWDQKKEDYVSAIWETSGAEEKTFRERQLRFGLQATALALFLQLFFSFVPELSRITHTLMLTQIFLIPMLLMRLSAKDKKRNRVLTGFVVCAAAIFFLAFLWKAQSPDIRILPYRTFLFHEAPAAIIE